MTYDDVGKILKNTINREDELDLNSLIDLRDDSLDT
jgi:hypothetical protein